MPPQPKKKLPTKKPRKTAAAARGGKKPSTANIARVPSASRLASTNALASSLLHSRTTFIPHKSGKAAVAVRKA